MTSIRFKIMFLVVSLALGEAVVLAAIGYSSVRTAARANAESVQAILSLEDKNAFVLSVTQAAAEARIVAVTPSAEARASFEREWGHVQKRLESCDNVACHGVAVKPRRMLDEIRSASESIESVWSRIAVGTPSPEDVSAIVPAIEQSSEQMVAAAARMSARIQERLVELEANTNASRQAALVLIVLTTIGTVLLAMGLYYPVVNSITNPILDLVEGVGRVAAGDLAHRVPVAGGAETAILARAFNEMASRLHQHQSFLQEEIRKRDESLSASERLATLGVLAASVAHEINNPLTTVLMNAQLVLEKLPESHPERRLVQLLVEDAERCRSIVSELRLIGKRRVGESTECDLDELLSHAIRATGKRAEAQRVALEKVPGECSGTAVCDRQRLLQVLINLIENALDVAPERSRIELRARSGDSGAVIEVKDEGPGIPPETRGRVFDQFFTTKARGLGLGLAIARHLVQEHDGKLEFETFTLAERPQGPTGTTFRVTLPRKQERP